MQFSIALEDVDDSVAKELFEILRQNESKLSLDDAVVFWHFPIYRDAEDEVVSVPILLLSPRHGAVLIGVSEASTYQSYMSSETSEALAHAATCLFSRLIRNKALVNGVASLKIPLSTFTFAPLLADSAAAESDNSVLKNSDEIIYFLQSRETNISSDLFEELLSTAEGSKALDKSKKRNLQNQPPLSKGVLAKTVEDHLNKFDRNQRRSYATTVKGPERIRGLAGSGKTVILAMKAAKAHIENPDAVIVYTFYTRSLYQHIRKLITKFCKQFQDKGPDWEKLKVMHGWGASDMPGVYRTLSRHVDRRPISFSEAARLSKQPFDYVCSDLLTYIQPEPIFDFMFIDEGQDFPASFIKLAERVVKDRRFVLAYDDLQTIFQATPPSAAQIFGVDQNGNALLDFQKDFVLPICYRNPREVLIAAHALGFGLYGAKKVQMLESEEHWKDIGYTLASGKLEKGQTVVFERPLENTLAVISDSLGKSEILDVMAFATPKDEVEAVIASVKKDLSEGLEPDDILIIAADDRNAKNSWVFQQCSPVTISLFWAYCTV